MRRRGVQVFVAAGDAPGQIMGYYSLSAASFEKEELPADLAKRLPHSPVPAAVLGRPAIDLTCRGRGPGERLLLDAAHRVQLANAVIAVYASVVDAKNERARNFYEGDYIPQSHFEAPMFAGPAEADETCVGGKRRNMSNAKRKELTGRGTVGKTAVAGGQGPGRKPGGRAAHGGD